MENHDEAFIPFEPGQEKPVPSYSGHQQAMDQIDDLRDAIDRIEATPDPGLEEMERLREQVVADIEAGQAPATRRPVTVRFTRAPRPRLELEMDGAAVDVTPAVEGFELHVSVEGGVTTNALVLHLRADTSVVDWQAMETLVAGPDPVRVTAEEIQREVDNKGYSETIGEAVVAHLVKRGVVAPS